MWEKGKVSYKGYEDKCYNYSLCPIFYVGLRFGPYEIHVVCITVQISEMLYAYLS